MHFAQMCWECSISFVFKLGNMGLGCALVLVMSLLGKMELHVHPVMCTDVKQPSVTSVKIACRYAWLMKFFC